MPGNLAKALELSQTICDRIEVQRRQEKTDNGRINTEMDIPFMFAFRVLYNIGVIYLLVGSLQVSLHLYPFLYCQASNHTHPTAIYIGNCNHLVCISNPKRSG